jgi:hypothetical protein
MTGLRSAESAATDSPLDRATLLGRWRGDRLAAAGIWVVVLYTVLRNVLAAAAKPFWYDELCTVAVARQPNLSAMWKAFGHAEDSSTPLFWSLEHLFGRLAANQEIAYRLPSILGFGCVLWCLFVFVRRRNGAIVAFLCAILPILTPLYRPYAIEARGYTLAVACISIALVCYQRAPRWLWILLMGLSLIAAEAFHYYAFFAFFPFGLAEFTWMAKKREFRWGVWLALFAGFLPLALGWPHLMQLKQFYGTHFWGQASLLMAALAYGSLLRTAAPIAIAIVTVLSVVALWMALAPEFSGATERNGSDDNSHEPMLAVGFLSLLWVEFVVTRIAHGSLTERYALATVLGLALVTGYVVRVFGRRSIALVSIFLLVALSLDEGFSRRSERSHLGKLESPAYSVEALVSEVGHSNLPVVVSDGLGYVQLANYASPEWSKRFVGLVDPVSAIAYVGSDSVDRQMLALRCCLPLQVDEFQNFALEHSSFLLYSDGAVFDWWPRRLRRDGYRLELLAVENGQTLYLARSTTDLP